MSTINAALSFLNLNPIRHEPNHIFQMGNLKSTFHETLKKESLVELVKGPPLFLYQNAFIFGRLIRKTLFQEQVYYQFMHVFDQFITVHLMFKPIPTMTYLLVQKSSFLRTDCSSLFYQQAGLQYTYLKD